MIGRQSIPGQDHCSNRRQLNSSRKGRQDSHARVQTVQAGRRPGDWSWLDPSAGLERGRCARPPQVWHIVPDIDKILDIEENTSRSIYPDIALISCSTTSKFLPSISLYPDISIRYCTRYHQNFDIVSISSVQRASKLNIVPDIEGFYSISMQYRVYKERLFGASSISYPIQVCQRPAKN